MTVRQSTYSDLPNLMNIYRQAREIQLESGNPNQWREGYPSEDFILSEISSGVSHIIEDSGRAVGAFSFISGIDQTYLHIENGSWLDDVSPYCTIHRLGKLKDAHGISSVCFDWCSSRCQNLRIDTHRDNSIMRHCIEKAGFVYCGIIHLLNGDPRLAYQKISS